jgi:hypothetical protein
MSGGRRSDAGRPAITERDVAVLGWLGEQYGVRADVLGVLLGRYGSVPEGVSRRAVFKAVDRWERAGLARAVRLLGRTWVVPTRAGLDLAGAGYAVWSGNVRTLAHVHAASLVRLAVELTMPPGGRWVSERALRRELDQALGGRMRGHRLHLADGAIEAPDTGEWDQPPRVAVEVELTRKEHRRLPLIVRELRDSGYVRVIWFAAPEVERPLRATLERVQAMPGAAGGLQLEVRPLPQVAGLSYEVAR